MQSKLMMGIAALVLGLLVRQGCSSFPLTQLARTVEQGMVEGEFPDGGWAYPGGSAGNSGAAAGDNGSYWNAGYSGQGGAYTNSQGGQQQSQTATGYGSTAGAGSFTNDKIIIGSFNIEVFGRAKTSNPSVMAILLDICSRFDVLAIQELRSTEQNIVPNFVAELNRKGFAFSEIVGPRQGYTISKEQYVFIYNTRRIEVVGEPFVAWDPEDKMHRSPMVAQFRCRELSPDQAFTFALANVHTDPDEVPLELSRIAAISPLILQYLNGEDDLMVLGDFNAWPSVMAGYALLPSQQPLIPDEWVTNTAKTRNYDNIIISRDATAEFTGLKGVFDFETHYQLTREQAEMVSDHMPVWAQFSIREQRLSTAANQGFAPSLQPVRTGIGQ